MMDPEAFVELFYGDAGDPAGFFGKKAKVRLARQFSRRIT